MSATNVSTYKIIDTHTHYAHARFDCGRKEILESLSDAGIVAAVDGAIDFASNEKMLALCEQYPFLYAAVGCHPNCVGEMDEEKFAQIEKMLSHPKVLAIGETGLDYAGEKSPEQKQAQKEWFLRFVELAGQTGKPLVVHCREAYDDMIELFKGSRLLKEPGVIHCFSGEAKHVKALLDMGFYFGIGGKFTKSEEKYIPLREALCEIPLDRLLLETDCPYLLPEGLSGKRNTSLNLPHIAEELARLRGDSVEQILGSAYENTLRFLYKKIVLPETGNA